MPFGMAEAVVVAVVTPSPLLLVLVDIGRVAGLADVDASVVCAVLAAVGVAEVVALGLAVAPSHAL